MGMDKANGNKFKYMKLQTNLTILGFLAILLASGCPAQELGNWSFVETKAPDGTPVFTAAIHATNLITSGGPEPDYAPLYTIGCRKGDGAHWSQTLQFEDAISGSGKIELIARVDDKMPREENWVIGAKNRILVRENTPDVAELRSSHSLVLKWNWGWSWLWLSDTARFDLREVGAVIFTLAKSCGIAEP